MSRKRAPSLLYDQEFTCHMLAAQMQFLGLSSRCFRIAETRGVSAGGILFPGHDIQSIERPPIRAYDAMELKRTDPRPFVDGAA